MVAKPPTTEEQRLLNIIYKRNWEVEERTTEIIQLKANLAKHGGHTADCACWGPSFISDVSVSDRAKPTRQVPQCDCGWAELEKE